MLVHERGVCNGLQSNDLHAGLPQLLHDTERPRPALPWNESVGAHGRPRRLALGILGGGRVPTEVHPANAQALRRAEDRTHVECRPEVVEHQHQGDPRLGLHLYRSVRCRGSASRREVVRPGHEELVIPQTTRVLPLDRQGHGQEVSQVHVQVLHLLPQARQSFAILVFVPPKRQQRIAERLEQGDAQHAALLVPDALDALREAHEAGEARDAVLAHTVEGRGRLVSGGRRQHGDLVMR
mmetsp:Transcript_62851/g.173877  ORF Transcript_62851/g.173877 Transcript_62851/m.173877 type:complete len:239 (+) Transcript_62851:254-970(+)